MTNTSTLSVTFPHYTSHIIFVYNQITMVLRFTFKLSELLFLFFCGHFRCSKPPARFMYFSFFRLQQLHIRISLVISPLSSSLHVFCLLPPVTPLAIHVHEKSQKNTFNIFFYPIYYTKVFYIPHKHRSIQYAMNI